MKSLSELYCEEHRGSIDDVPRRIFWRCLYPHALPFAYLVGGYRSDYFAAERGLMVTVGQATRRSQVQSSIFDYFADLGNQRWLKRRFNLRISTRRLVHLSRHYLPSADSRPASESTP